MTLLHYAEKTERKMPARKRGKIIQFKGVEFEREFLMQLSDNDLAVVAAEMAKAYAAGFRAERDRLLAEMMQLGPVRARE
jgi:hypothetical protein